MQDNKNYTKQWLNKRGITNEVIAEFGLKWSTHSLMGGCIFLPVHDENGAFSFNKYRRDPLQDEKPKYMYDKGASMTLYGWHKAKEHDDILITEGEMDTLVAWSANIPAMCSTGGAMSFQKEWADLLEGKNVTICYDNDDAGVRGAVKTLGILPNARVLLIPERPNIKDISDYVAHGGDLRELLRTARTYEGMEEVREDRSAKASMFESVRFHDAYIDAHKQVALPNSRNKLLGGSELDKVKEYPIGRVVTFDNSGKAPCVWHKEKTPSMHWYKKTNSVYCFGCNAHGDVIDVYRQVFGVSFGVAVREIKKHLGIK